MNKKTCIGILAFFFLGNTNLYAQPFLQEAKVEYEVRTNIQKTLGTGMYAEMMKENLPQFKTGYYNFIFKNNASVYKFDRWESTQKIPKYLTNDDEESIWYSDFTKQTMGMQKTVAGSKMLVLDSLPHIDWKISNENRVIAGFNCRKAEGIIMDSVYVFAFFSEEIMVPGGPCSVNGLPGLILGMTIPRLYTSWIATQVSVVNVPAQEIKPLTAKKTYSFSSLGEFISNRMSEWIDMEDEESKNYFQQMQWRLLL